MKRALKQRSFREAAAFLENGMDDWDLPSDLTEDEEHEMREFIRDEIPALLRKRGGAEHAKGGV